MTNNIIVIVGIALYLAMIALFWAFYFDIYDLETEETTLKQRLILLATSALWPVVILVLIGLLISSGVYWIATGKRLLQ